MTDIISLIRNIDEKDSFIVKFTAYCLGYDIDKLTRTNITTIKNKIKNNKFSDYQIRIKTRDNLLKLKTIMDNAHKNKHLSSVKKIYFQIYLYSAGIVTTNNYKKDQLIRIYETLDKPMLKERLQMEYIISRPSHTLTDDLIMQAIDINNQLNKKNIHTFDERIDEMQDFAAFRGGADE